MAARAAPGLTVGAHDRGRRGRAAGGQRAAGDARAPAALGAPAPVRRAGPAGPPGHGRARRRERVGRVEPPRPARRSDAPGARASSARGPAGRARSFDPTGPLHARAGRSRPLPHRPDRHGPLRPLRLDPAAIRGRWNRRADRDTRDRGPFPAGRQRVRTGRGRVTDPQPDAYRGRVLHDARVPDRGRPAADPLAKHGTDGRADDPSGRVHAARTRGPRARHALRRDRPQPRRELRALCRVRRLDRRAAVPRGVRRSTGHPRLGPATPR